MKFTEEDKEMVARLIRGFEHDLEELRNDKYGHDEIVPDLKESCREKMIGSKHSKSEWSKNQTLTS